MHITRKVISFAAAPIISAVLAFTVAMHTGPSQANAPAAAPEGAPTPYSADHARILADAASAPTF
jgi:hypothetical protein